MTQSQFNILPLDKKADLLFTTGNYCGVREYYNYKLNLYSIDDFFAEVWYNPEDNKIEKIEAVNDSKVLDRYIDYHLKTKEIKKSEM